MSDLFPRTMVGGVSLSRLVIGTNWILGYSHRSPSADRLITRRHAAAESVADLLEVFLNAGVDTIMGLLFGKLMAVVTGGKINPLIGACGISAFPMAGRLSAKMAQDEDFENFILMHAMGSNTAGQLGSVIAGGLLLTLVLSV